MKKVVGKVRPRPASKPGPLQRAVAAPAPGFPLVAMGASAGGLDAFQQFFHAMPVDSGMAFVLVPHLDPDHASALTEILQRSTSMPVVEATDGMPVTPNRVHIVPPNRDMTVVDGVLKLALPENPHGLRMPIDSFLRSVADDQGERAIGVILSGTGSDGSLGLRAILGAGGVSFVQEPASARFDGMPASAIRAGLATYVLPAGKLAAQLCAYVRTGFAQRRLAGGEVLASATNLTGILSLVRANTGHDFSQYRKGTIFRRIERRMMVHGIADLKAYGRFLKQHPKECQALFKELLINVTTFFRDAEAFERLKKEVLPRLFDTMTPGRAFRVWSVGCATGEETYSLAMVLREYMDETHRNCNVQIYGTDLDEDAIAVARAGAYTANVAADLSPDRLRQFLVKEDDGYRVKKSIREMVVFAVQNAIKDPPFTHLDLIVCRNVLIYLEPELQGQLISAFHYALRPGGVLWLSPSEGLGDQAELFTTLNRKWKLYQARPSHGVARAVLASGLSWASAPPGQHSDVKPGQARSANLGELASRVLLDAFAPASVITDDKGNVLFVHGDTGRFLRPAPGRASLSVVDMAREGLQTELRAGLQAVAASKKPVVLRARSATPGKGARPVSLALRTISEKGSASALVLISFHEAPPEVKSAPDGKHRREPRGVTGRVEALRRELATTREDLQATIEELQASNEEIKSTNEELQSTNEELQSTNEELETSKEELQAVNEELVIVNSEYQSKIEQLTELQSDLKNLMESTNIGTIFLDDTLALKRFTKGATSAFRLVASDVGRHLADIKSNLVGEVDLVEEARAVLESLAPRELEVQAANGDPFLARLHPYRTLDNVIEGVVLTFTNLAEVKRSEAATRAAREYAQSIVETIREPLVVVDPELKVVSAGRSFYRAFGVTPEVTVGRSLFALGAGQWDSPLLRQKLAALLASDVPFEDLPIEADFPGLGARTLHVNARRVRGLVGGAPLILLAMERVAEPAEAR